MTPDELRSLGEASGIKGWQTWLARTLPMNSRTVRRWLAGKTRIHPAVAERIRHLFKRKPTKERL